MRQNKKLGMGRAGAIVGRIGAIVGRIGAIVGRIGAIVAEQVRWDGFWNTNKSLSVCLQLTYLQ